MRWKKGRSTLGFAMLFSRNAWVTDPAEEIKSGN
jgi:hypothetical protein